MKNKTYRKIIYVICIIFLLMSINNFFISCDIHIWNLNEEECNRCLVIYNLQEMLKNIFVITCIILLLFKVKILEKVVTVFKNIIYTNLILFKVILIE